MYYIKNVSFTKFHKTVPRTKIYARNERIIMYIIPLNLHVKKKKVYCKKIR